MAHVNNGHCDKCQEIFARYPGFHTGIQSWFAAVQKRYPDAHISCAGRGKADQEACFHAGTSRAHYGQSSHNYNMAVDFFRLTLTGADFSQSWFRDVVGGSVLKHNADPNNFLLSWYGLPGSKFLELPHVELLDWREELSQGKISLVEPA